MTQIEQIKAEVERLQEYYKQTYAIGSAAKANCLNEVLDFINSLQAEPVSEEAILRRAIKMYGIHAQIDMALEEMGELIVALQHGRRGRASHVEVCEEVADVQIMMEQLAMIFDKDIVRKYYESKIKRLEQRLNKED